MSLKVLNSKVDRYSLGLATSFYKKKELVSKKRPNVRRKWAIQIYTTFRQKEKKKKPVKAIKRLHYLNGISTSASLVMMPCGGFSWIVFS